MTKLFTTETLDKLYLELSNITQAKTRREIALETELERRKEEMYENRSRLQYLVDNWPVQLEDGCISFPDGMAIYQSRPVTTSATPS